MCELFPFFAAKPEDEAEARWSRLFEGADCRTSRCLARALGVRASSVLGAKRRGVIPPDWLVRAVCLYGVNPYWILHGKGPKYLVPGEPPIRAADEDIVHSVLRCFPSAVLEKELLRRRIE